MDNDVSAGNASPFTLGHLAPRLTLLAFGIGHKGAVDGVTAADAVSFALYVGGIALFVAGLLEFRAGDGFTGTAFAGLGAFRFTRGTGADARVSDRAAGLFLLLRALFALTLTLGAAGRGLLGQGTYGLLSWRSCSWGSGSARTAAPWAGRAAGSPRWPVSPPGTGRPPRRPTGRRRCRSVLPAGV